MLTQRTSFVDPLLYSNTGIYADIDLQPPQNFVNNSPAIANKTFASNLVLNTPPNLDLGAITENGQPIIPLGNPANNEAGVIADKPTQASAVDAKAPAPGTVTPVQGGGGSGGGFSRTFGAGKFDNIPSEAPKPESKDFDYKGFISKYGKTIATVVLLGVFLYIASKYFTK